MKPRYSDQEVDKLLREHAASTPRKMLSEDERTHMIASLLAADSTRSSAPRPLRAGFFSSLRRPPMLAVAATAFGLLVLVAVGVVKYGFLHTPSRQIGRLVNTPAERKDSSVQSDPPEPVSEPRKVTLAAIPVIFQARGGENTTTSDSLAFHTFHRILSEELRPLGISTTARDLKVKTSLVVRVKRDSPPTRLAFHFDAATGEVTPQPASFYCDDPMLSPEKLRTALRRVEEQCYRALR